jgi:hypothetical protein
MRAHHLIAFMFVAMPTVAFAQAPAVHFGSDWRPMDVRSCTIKAMDAMQAQNFIEGTRTGEAAWGFNEQSIVLVHCVPQNRGVHIQVLAASWSGQEAERLRNQIRISVFDNRRPNLGVLHPDGFNNDSGVFGPQRRPRNFPSMHWGYDTRPKSLGACVNAAKLAMHRTGLQGSPGGQALIWGKSARVTVLVECVPVQGTMSILVAAASGDGQVAERFRNDVRKITFDTVAID